MWFERDLRYDRFLLLGVIFLTGLGIVMIYSTSSITAERVYNIEGSFFLKRQLISALIGIVLMVCAMHLNHEKLRQLIIPCLIVSIILLVAVLIPGIGTEVRGGSTSGIKSSRTTST